MARDLPTRDEALRILARHRTRPQRRPPPTGGRALMSFIRDLDARFGQGPGALQARWREIVGEQIARRTEPVKLTRPRGGGPGALEIRVAGPAAAIIQHQGPEIIARVNLFLGTGAIDKLRIVQGPLRNEALRQTARPARRIPPPLDAGREAALADSLRGAPDGPLKDALMDLGRGVLRRDPGR